MNIILAPSNISKSSFYSISNCVTVKTHTDAQKIVNAMFNVIDKYGMATIGNLYDFAGRKNDISDFEVVAEYYGWIDIDQYSITKVEDFKWVLCMPPYEFLRKEN